MPELRKDPDYRAGSSLPPTARGGPWTSCANRSRPSDGRYCPFCEGHESKTPPEVLAYRNGSQPNQPGWSLRVVPNKFPVLEDRGRSRPRRRRALRPHAGHRRARGGDRGARARAQHYGAAGACVEQVLWAFRDRVLDLKNDRAPALCPALQESGRRARGRRSNTRIRS